MHALILKYHIVQNLTVKNVWMDIYIYIHIYVAEFAKRGLTHASDFSTLRRCNSASVGPTALKIGS